MPSPIKVAKTSDRADKRARFEMSERGAANGGGQPPSEKKTPLNKSSADTRHRLEIAAHDLRNPVSAMIGLTEILSEEAHDRLNTFERELLADILTAGNATLKHIEYFLDLASSGASHLHLSQVDLPSIVNESVSLHRALSELRRVHLEVRINDSLPTIKLDRSKILRVVNELVSDAIKGSEADQTVEVGLRDRGRFAEIVVRDERPRMAAELDQMFEPFPARHLLPERRGGEMGFALVNEIVTAHRGRIRVSETANAGTMFVVSLPK